jgi:hypothetical protein
MVKIQSFQGDKPHALDGVVEEWLAKQPQNLKIISFCKYCAPDGRRHFCSILYEVHQTDTETSSPSKK